MPTKWVYEITPAAQRDLKRLPRPIQRRQSTRTRLRNLVEGKLRTAGDLYTFMVDQFLQGRAFVMEFLIIFILIIDLVFLFKDAWQS